MDTAQENSGLQDGVRVLREVFDQGINDVATIVRAFLPFPKREKGEKDKEYNAKLTAAQAENLYMLATIGVAMAKLEQNGTKLSTELSSSRIRNNNPDIERWDTSSLAPVFLRVLRRDINTKFYLKSIEAARPEIEQVVGPMALSRLDALESCLCNVQTTGTKIFADRDGNPTSYEPSGLLQICAGKPC